VITPLSYGSKDYALQIASLGKQLLGDRFKAVLSFMTVQEYFELVKGCRVFVMNHYRQQALGNICLALAVGGKIFLSPKNPLLFWLREKGAIVFEISALANLTLSELMQPLGAEDRVKNRAVVLTNFGFEELRKKTAKLITWAATTDNDAAQ
jgi:hypothetical protein